MDATIPPLAAARHGTRTVRGRPSWRGVTRLLWWIGFDVTVPTLWVVWSDSTFPPMLFGDVVVEWEFAYLALLVVGCGCLIATFVMWGMDPQPRPGRAWPRVRTATTAIVGAALLALALCAGYLLVFIASTYHVLPPASDTDCRVVLERTGPGGGIWLARPGEWTLTPTSATWWALDDDSTYDPVAAGTWSLTWRGGRADLQLWGPDIENDIESHPISCPP